MAINPSRGSPPFRLSREDAVCLSGTPRGGRYGKSEHGPCEAMEERCASCHGKHKSDNSSCPLRPRWFNQGWVYPNWWTVRITRVKNDTRDKKAVGGEGKGKGVAQAPPGI
ncbi:hypothetical protein AOQ84DRAFT_383001 [Glonium stellatum]|uniref:Uncharacterized protein n=1 Tax=Glonium stellatum TaxID=574774 RepID=A0A8E2JLT5_9PEZI|nr:hypothetical protein AOQ84DRAFT_383001 [Glonium stellatum]